MRWTTAKVPSSRRKTRWSHPERAGLAGAEDGQDDIAAAAGQADEGGVVAFAFGSVAVVEGFGGGVAQRGEDGQEHGALEPVVTAAAAGIHRPGWCRTGG